MQVMKVYKGSELQTEIELDGVPHSEIVREREIQEENGYTVAIGYQADHEWGDLPDDIEADDHSE